MPTIAAPTLGEAAHRHCSSHCNLLHRRAKPAGVADIDAIIVPAGRSAAELEPAVALAARYRCPLVVFCSHDAKAAEVNQLWGNAVGAVDVRHDGFLPHLLTSAILDGTPFARDHNDTSLKRNAGLAVMRMTGWQRVLLLDDDITGVASAQLGRAASLLDDFEVVGLENDGYPDNSVVCHANRAAGAAQCTFIGAGAMLIAGSRATSFFPDVYNEDWLFLMEDDGLTRCATHGSFAQKAFDPFDDPLRAGTQEFGDVLAEGLFALLDSGCRLEDARQDFWYAYLAERAKLIASIRRRLRTTAMRSERRARIDASLLAARTHLRKISPWLCVAYLAAWQADRTRWRDWIGDLPTGLSATEALSHLGFEV